MKNQDLYYVLHVPRNFGKNSVVEENLTKEQAQDMVQEDMKTNPKAKEYMWVWKKQLK